MRPKQAQAKHWFNRICPYATTLDKLYNRAGRIEDLTAMRIFRLELSMIEVSL